VISMSEADRVIEACRVISNLDGAGQFVILVFLQDSPSTFFKVSVLAEKTDLSPRKALKLCRKLEKEELINSREIDGEIAFKFGSSSVAKHIYKVIELLSRY